MPTLNKGRLFLAVPDYNQPVGSRPTSILCALTSGGLVASPDTNTIERTPCDPMEPSSKETFHTAMNWTISATAILHEYGGAAYNQMTTTAFIEMAEREYLTMVIGEIDNVNAPNMHWYAVVNATFTGGNLDFGRLKEEAPFTLNMSLNHFKYSDIVFPGVTAGIPTTAALPLV